MDFMRYWYENGSPVMAKSGNYLRKNETQTDSKRKPRSGLKMVRATFERNLFNGLAVLELGAHDLDKGVLVDNGVKPP